VGKPFDTDNGNINTCCSALAIDVVRAYPVHWMKWMPTQHQVAANPQTVPADSDWIRMLPATLPLREADAHFAVLWRIESWVQLYPVQKCDNMQCWWKLLHNKCRSRNYLQWTQFAVPSHSKSIMQTLAHFKCAPFLVFWLSAKVLFNTRMWANAQRDGRPAKYRWRPLFNAQSLADAHC